jgi:hypothetical protein
MKNICIFVVALGLAHVVGCGHLEANDSALASWSIAVTDSVDIDRGSWPIVARVKLPAGIDDPVFVLRREGRQEPVAHQVLAVVEPDVARLADVADVNDGLVDVCFFTDLSGCGMRRFDLDLVAKPRQATLGAPELQYRGERFGTRVDAGAAEFAFDAVSGQFMTYVPQQSGRGEEMGFVQDHRKPIHWNPDVWIPPAAWGHVSDWNTSKPELTPDFNESRGPLAYRSVRRGVMPNSNETLAEVSYTVFAGMPFILETSRMEFTNDTDIGAVRHNELVFSRGTHTHGIWPDDTGTPQLGRLFDPEDPKKIYGQIKRMKADIPWVGLVHPYGGYGIAIVNNWYGSSAPEGKVGPQDENAVYYLLDYGEHAAENFHFNFSYVCRTLLPPVTVVKGSVFGERSAFLTFSVGPAGEARYDYLLRWTKLLGNLPVVEVMAD